MTGRRRLDYIVVARGEPCPRTVPSAAAIATAVPSLAWLRGQARGPGGVVCTYEHLGRTYPVTLRGRSTCPATPNIL